MIFIPILVITGAATFAFNILTDDAQNTLWTGFKQGARKTAIRACYRLITALTAAERCETRRKRRKAETAAERARWNAAQDFGPELQLIGRVG